MSKPKPNALQTLIAERRAEKNLTYDEIARRGKLSKATVYKLATGGVQGLPQRRTLESLAKGLGLPDRVVREAAVRAALTTSYTEDLSEWEKVVIGHSRELSDAERRQVMSLIEAMLNKE